MANQVENQYGEGESNKQTPPGYRSLSDLITGMVRPYKKWLLLIFLAMIAETVMSLAVPWPLKIIIDNVIAGSDLPGWLSWVHALLPNRELMTLAASCAVALVLFTAIEGIAAYIESYLTESVAQNMANDLRKRIYHHLQKLSLAYYDTHQVAKLLSTITTDVTTIQDFVASTLLSILVDLLTIAGMFALMLYLKWDFALVAVGMAPFLLLFVIRFKKAVKKATHEVRTNQAEMTAILQHGLESIRTVNAFGRQDLEEKMLNRISQATLNSALHARRIKSLISPVFTLAVAVCTAFVLWRGAGLVMSGSMTVGALTVYLAYLSKFFNPVKDLGKMTVNIAQATVALERIQLILGANTVIPQKPDAVAPGTLKGQIVFENVCFSYQPGVQVLKDINLDIEPGQRVGICGPTGGGKTSIVSLIPRLYDATSGHIRIDGMDVTDYTLDGLRKEIGFVLQDTMLFYGSVRDNIAYGRPDANEEEIKQAARLAHADEFIHKLPMGYDTIIGERGLTLSGGERQRIGIARAIVRNSPILILDEPTASLDTESEKEVGRALEKLMKGRTVITVSHKLNTLMSSDKIFVVKEGVIVETGSHASLLAANGVYAGLYKLQNAGTT